MPKNKIEDVVRRLNHECERRKKIEKKLKQRLAFEKTVSAISSRFIAVKNINAAIDQTLRDIGRLSGASRAYVFFFSEDEKTMSNTHEWCRKGVSAQMHTLQDAPVTLIPYAIIKLKKGEVIHIPDVSKLPKSANKDKKLIQKQGIKSMLVVPLYIAGKLAGFAGFDNVTETGEWNDDDLMLLRICSEIVGKAFDAKESEDKLKESEEQFRVLAEENPNMIYIHDFKGIAYANQKAVDIMGYTRKEGYSKEFNFMDFIAPEFRPKISKAVMQHVKGQEIEPFECALITKKGKRLDVIIATKLIRYQRKPAALGIVTDISDRKKAEAKVKEYAEKLEGKVEERTKKFTNANKELQKRINELERFHNLTVGRELKMIELKQEIKELELKLSAKKK